MTAQEYLTLLLDTFEAGGFPAINHLKPGIIVKCRYLTSDGKRCGIGLLVKPGCYISEIEGLAATDVLGMHSDIFEVVDGFVLEDYQSVQTAHDDAVGSKGEWFATDFLQSLTAITGFEFCNKSRLLRLLNESKGQVIT